ncbi:MAG: exo-alpha-sialidase [Chloroflexi bacterium]|nr:exo-alpha-sialidase [Chloroflexota bacterium]
MARMIQSAIFLISIAVTACATTPTPTVVPTSTATVAPMAPPTIFAPQPSATLAPSVKPVPSTTRAASATPTKLATLTPTRVPIVDNPNWFVHTILVGPGRPGRLYALLADVPYVLKEIRLARLVISDDSGATWTAFAGGIPVEPACLGNVNLDYATRDALYASTCRGLYAWSNNEWKQISSKNTLMVAIVYGQPKIIWGLDQQGAGIIKSVDGGKTWQASATGPISFSGLANLAIDPREPNLLYGIINPKYGGSYLRRGKTDGNWDTIPTPMNNAQIDVGMTIDGGTGDLYVTAYDGTASRWSLWRSRNPSIADVNRVSWELVYEFGYNQWATILASGSSAQGLALYILLNEYEKNLTSVVRSLDSGKTWKTIEIR